MEIAKLTATLDHEDDDFEEFLAAALALRGGKPYPSLESIEEAVADGPFSRSEIYRRGPRGTAELEFCKIGNRTKVVTLTRLRAAARLPRVPIVKREA